MNERSFEAEYEQLIEQTRALPPEQRESFLREHCDDEQLRRKVLKQLDEAVCETNSIDLAPTDEGGPRPQPPRTSRPTFEGPTITGYLIEREIGRGGMGAVFKARHRDTDRIVALKVIRPDRAAYASAEEQNARVDRFRTEALAAAKLEHANIVTVYDVGEEAGVPYYAMRFVEGESLAEVVRESPLLSRRAAEYIEAAARALHEAHQSGVLHRDLKPHNIMIDRKTNQALIADFGLAKLREGGQSATMTGEVFGSPPYMSPEQATDAAGVTEASDIYGLGATLYHLLTGRPPFQGANTPQTLKQVLDQEPVAPRELNPDIDADLETICLKCLEKDRVRRYHSAEALADDLRRYLNDQTITARPAGRLERFGKFTKRNRGLVFGVSAAIIALTLGLIGTASGLVWALDERGKAQRRQNELKGKNQQLVQKELQRAKAVLATLEQSGDLAAQRGRWRLAADSYQKALQEQPADPIPLRIKRARALIAAMEATEARREAEAIMLAEGVNAHLGAALLLRAEAEATRFDSKDKGIGFYREALATGQLNESDAHYVQSVLADRVDVAIANAEAAIALDPFRKDANEFLVVLYAMSGQRSKLLDHVQVLKGSFPEDVNYVFLDAMLLVLDGQTEEAKELLDSIEDQLSQAQLNKSKDYLMLISDMLDVVTAAAEGRATVAELFPAVRKMNKLTSLLGRDDQSGNLSPVNDVTAYPVMQPLADAVPMLSMQLVALPTSSRGTLKDLAEKYPMHELHMLHGQICYYSATVTPLPDRKTSNMIEAEASLERALRIEPLITRMPPLARLNSLAAQMELIFHKKLDDEASIEAMRGRAKRNLRVFIEALADRNHRWHAWTYERLWMLIAASIGTENFDEGRALLREWIAIDPKSGQAYQWLARLEELEGNPLSSIAAADRANELNPELDRAQKSRKAAVAMLRKAVQEMGITPATPDEEPSEEAPQAETPNADADSNRKEQPGEDTP